ncbi:hypothetical protein C7459_12076 [Tumebacillus permanentifrigoris]|uniref:Uncharacterized protein n=1 Tax=Tumebacillus permanentifrigoris TaxID=378543 RepID=A0A316D3V7_9BACL|nr:hypothetical protein C7459_12076 [Tumebacillus permanentifrigoris]
MLTGNVCYFTISFKQSQLLFHHRVARGDRDYLSMSERQTSTHTLEQIDTTERISPPRLRISSAIRGIAPNVRRANAITQRASYARQPHRSTSD